MYSCKHSTYGICPHTNSVNSVIIPFHVDVVVVSHQCQEVDVCFVKIFRCTLKNSLS